MFTVISASSVNEVVAGVSQIEGRYFGVNSPGRHSPALTRQKPLAQSVLAVHGLQEWEPTSQTCPPVQSDVLRHSTQALSEHAGVGALQSAALKH